MIAEKSLVAYKNRPAVVSGFDGEKIALALADGGAVKVRAKDIELVHAGPCALKDFDASSPPGNAREAWELLAAETEAVSLRELAELVFGEYTPRAAWEARELVREGRYFCGNSGEVKARPRGEVEEDEKRREEKAAEAEGRAAFLERMKKLPARCPDAAAENVSETDRRFLQDVEALARGKTDKSRTLKDLGKAETPEEAHRLLLAAGVWTVWTNPHPERFGLAADSAKAVPSEPFDETQPRRDLTRMAAYAIDSPWSDDPDDAVSLEGPDAEGRYCLWVHVADPAASVTPESEADTEARNRGATLFLPEGAVRMLSPELLSRFVLRKNAPALSFKLTLAPDLRVAETEITPSLVNVTRLTYEEADAVIAGEAGTAEERAVFSALAALAERNVERRLDSGAVMIELPEARIHVSVNEKTINVEQVKAFRSAAAVRECMIWAGEGAARWAIQRQLPFPFISQEAGELPEERLSGLAGQWQLRRCMRPRGLSSKPGVHWGLGLDEYTQVTSPLRRYTDLACHQQIRAFLRGEKTLDSGEILFRISAAEAAASAVSRAERASRAHWFAVYLAGRKDSTWEGIVVDRKGNRAVIIIPALGIETQVNLRGGEKPNDIVTLKLVSVKIPEGEVNFAAAD